MERRPGKAGFSLLELLVVVVIVSILAAILLPRFGTTIDKTRVARAEQELRSLHLAFSRVYFDTNYYPSEVLHASDVGLVNKRFVPANLLELWDGPYLERWPESGHPWGGRYVYRHRPKREFNFDNSLGNEVWVEMRGGALTRRILNIIDKQMDDGRSGDGLILHDGGNTLYYFLGEGPNWGNQNKPR
ncbi:MAG: prepilin-type N-terminal cleavage/methylation domain-containing protein [Planctomycetota bacterium]|nr:MAG: prepilin-type N-terminal cleavage/methylation domain-containing protein [Planctomycetota bacterium]